MHGIKGLAYINFENNITPTIRELHCIKLLRRTHHTIANISSWNEPKLTPRQDAKKMSPNCLTIIFVNLEHKGS